MAKTFAQLTQEIEVLKTQAEAARKQEMAGVIARIKEAIAAYGLTAQDLGVGGKPVGTKVPAKTATPSKAPTKHKAARKTKAAVKYRDDAGNTWAGMGPRPAWLKASLAAGQSLEGFAVSGHGKDAAPVAGKTASAKSGKPTPKPVKPVSAVKYKDALGHAWSGRGPKPGWIKEAIAGGKRLEELVA